MPKSSRKALLVLQDPSTNKSKPSWVAGSRPTLSPPEFAEAPSKKQCWAQSVSVERIPHQTALPLQSKGTSRDGRRVRKVVRHRLRAAMHPSLVRHDRASKPCLRDCRVIRLRHESKLENDQSVIRTLCHEAFALAEREQEPLLLGPELHRVPKWRTE